MADNPEGPNCFINIEFSTHLLRMLHMEFGFDWPSGFREDL